MHPPKSQVSSQDTKGDVWDMALQVIRWVEEQKEWLNKLGLSTLVLTPFKPHINPNLLSS